MQPNVNHDYKAIQGAGKWSTIFIWLQIITLPLLILLPYLINMHTITAKTFVVDALINVVVMTIFIVLLVIKGEPLKHPENMSLQQIKRDLNWLSVLIAANIVISLVAGGRLGLLTILFLVAVARAKRVAVTLEKSGQQYVRQ
jgi:uncharacterized membrane protein